ncbi:AAL085Cp [Eremothecium gossypii ATCC 10895]|uniref:AAL085Cp n=1 Tax=Eremothecium gossypii (strain ATCC 10895 / CBS 109.51 / FGSC 9923 / NRRL Y-1056) TaxID=284811 RepID=Q75F13_EREGS|nr:AAL085Cp [Eremothecium gossypii ATCC 10895]AAS50281.2 AAL085Cp [Eremothecium gossypii ATCC 10895]AEY94567.1 FAAL085Cp [Eremothecium gossypii FDAG1]
MSNFFRDNKIGFKPRSNIFLKMRSKESLKEAEADSSDSSGADSHLFLRGDGVSNTSVTTGTSAAENSMGSAVHMQPTAMQMSTPKATKVLLALDGKDEGPNMAPLYAPGSEHDSGVHSRRPGDKGSESPSAVAWPRRKRDLAMVSGNDASSNDVLSEAFANTQRIYSNLKQELDRQHAKNEQQQQEIELYRNEIEAIRGKVSNYRNLLTALEDDSKLLLEQKNNGEKKLEQLRLAYDSMAAKVGIFQKQSSELKMTLEDLRSLTLARESQLKGKDAEIEHLKDELNNYTYQLDQEKVKNSELLHVLGGIKAELKELAVTVVEQCGSDASANMNTILGEVNSMKSTFAEELMRRLEPLGSIIGTKSAEQIKIIKEQTELLSSKLQEENEKSTQLLAARLEPMLQELLSRWNESGKLQKSTCTSIEEGQTRLIDTLKVSSDLVREQVEAVRLNFMEQLKGVEKYLDKFGCQLDKNSQYENQVVDLQKQVHNIALQKSEVVALMKVKDTEVDSLNAQLLQSGESVNSLRESNSALDKQVIQLGLELTRKVEENTRICEELTSEKATFEQKFEAQKEVVKLLTHEAESLKSRLEQCEGEATAAKKDKQEALDKFQQLQEHLHKLNVDAVQLKAHELELVEENRKLKVTVDGMESANKEDENELFKLKEQVKIMDLEKHNFITERLDYQDKIESLEKQLTQLRKQLQKENEISRDVKQAPVKPPHPEPLVYSSAVVPDRNSHNDDEFDLSSSLNDELDLTNPSPIQIKTVPAKRKNQSTAKAMPSRKGKASSNINRKKLLSDDDDELACKLKKKKRF